MQDSGTIRAVVPLPVERRYPALRTISSLFKLIAWLTLLIAIGGACLLVATAGSLAGNTSTGGSALVGLLIAGGVFLIGLIWMLLLYGIGEAIVVLVDIEQNTRTSAVRP